MMLCTIFCTTHLHNLFGRFLNDDILDNVWRIFRQFLQWIFQFDFLQKPIIVQEGVYFVVLKQFKHPLLSFRTVVVYTVSIPKGQENWLLEATIFASCHNFLTVFLQNPPKSREEAWLLLCRERLEKLMSVVVLKQCKPPFSFIYDCVIPLMTPTSSCRF